jgi:glyoxylase-like metal-dependent hydrolase (beta-lactamase superfamily II)
MPPSGVVPLDAEHNGLSGAICVYLLEGPEPTLVDPGPSTSLDTLERRLREVGIPSGELRHLLLTHVHLDHAGAAGHLARANPRLTVHVHEDGAPHMVDPERLVASTRRTFGDAHDELWGQVLPVPRDQVKAWRPGDPRPLPGIRPLPTPGHIAHHLAWEAEGPGVLFAGDSLGIILHPEGPSHSATPPPSLDLAAWRRTLEHTLAPVEVDAFGVTHFGLHDDLHARRTVLLGRLRELTRRVAAAMEQGEAAEEEDRDAFHEETLTLHKEHLADKLVDGYFSTFSARTDWDGVRFHLARVPEAKDRILAD